MSKTKWLILAAVVVAGGIGVVVLIALGFGLFIGEREANTDLPVYQSDQTNSVYAGYRRTTLTGGTNVFVNDYAEAGLQLANPDPQSVVGLYGFGGGKMCAIPGQPVTAYVAGDMGSEMPAYVPFRNTHQPPFDWRTATFREMTVDGPGGRGQYLTTTNTALLMEVVRTLRDGTPVALPAFSFVAITSLATLRLTSDQLPGLQFCPSVRHDPDGTLYVAESLTYDTTSGKTQLNGRWIPATPTLTLWLNSQ